MSTPIQAQPVTRSASAGRTQQGGVNASRTCVSAKCEANGQCCAKLPGIGNFCIDNPLPFGGSAKCCLGKLFPLPVCCELFGQQIGCFP